MKTKQVNPMPAFVGIDFDCHFSSDLKNSLIDVGLLGAAENLVTRESYWLLDSFNSISGYRQCRPRLNKPQVLPDWGWLDNPLLDGAVWDCLWYDQEDGHALKSRLYNSTYAKVIFLSKVPYCLSFMGVQQGSQLEDWAKANDVPIYNDGMEVVK